MKHLVTILLLWLSIGTALAGESPYPVDKLDSLKLLNYIKAREDVRAYLKQTEYDIKGFEANIQELSDNRERFRWHAFASKVIFWVVIAIVLCGIVFAGIQFYNSLKPVGKHVQLEKETLLKTASAATSVTAADGDVEAAPEQRTDADTGQLATSLKVSPQGIEVRSSVLGVIILTISIVFFYLYLTIVYPMKPVSMTDNPTEEAAK